MPGTILVSVLEFVGLPFSSPSSSIPINVSMGKREYQTWDKGDFSFPLTTLRDNLIVVVQDAEGNEISKAGIETKSIVEKGLWDDLFPLEGGGHVHMKLEFVLNEEERNRIRTMRESAMKKKYGALVDCRTSSVEVATNSSNISSPLSHMISDKNEATSSAIPLSQEVDVHLSRFSYTESNEKVEPQSLSAKTPTRAVSSKGSPSSMNSSESSYSSRKRGSLEKIPSSVKKMISAFETNVAQDMQPEIKPPPAKLQPNKIGLDLKEGKTVNVEAAQVTGVEESQAEVSLHDYRDMDDSFKGSDAWIFPDQLGRFCVTTGGKKLMDFVGGYSIKPEIHQKKINSAAEKPGEDGGSGSEVDGSKKVKTHKMKKSKPKSEEIESSTGPVGQVVLPSKHHKISCY